MELAPLSLLTLFAKGPLDEEEDLSHGLLEFLWVVASQVFSPRVNGVELQTGSPRFTHSQLADLLGDPENEQTVQRAIAFLSNALTLRQMLETTIGKSENGLDEEGLPARPVSAEEIGKRTEDAHRRIDHIEAMQKEMAMDHTTVEEHYARMTAMQSHDGEHDLGGDVTGHA